MNQYNLGGHSGCGIFLFEDDNGATFVRKVSKDIPYNDRLIIQCEKQRYFPAGPIRTPKVLSDGYDSNGRYYFDMEYIHGVTLAEHMKTIEIGKIDGFVDAIVSRMIPHPVIAHDHNDPEKAFAKKIESLKQELGSANNQIIDNALSVLSAHDWSTFIPSQCHGDMTLENIIVRNDELYYIDFLDSFYDSWLMDAGTLLQDVQTLWSYRKDENISMNTIIRLIVFRDLLIEKIKAINPEYVREIYFALLLKLIRIYPYTADEQTYQFLNEKTQIVLNIINKL